MTLTPDQLHHILTEPEHAAHLADLVYIHDNHLTIHRKKYGRGYSYLIDNKTRLTDKDQLKRIKSLVIPPAWEEVRISKIPNGHLQCVGRDAKNRKVYRYHDIWSLLRNQTKFFKMAAFAKALPKIRKRITQDVSLNGMPLNKALAIVLEVMQETAIRVGSQQYATRNGTYGLSTLRTRHLNHEDDKLVFNFNGKKGVQQSIAIDDPELLDLIQQCEEIPGYELFQYYDDNKHKHTVDSTLINQYIHEIAGDIFSAKDFRTWCATCTFFEELLHLPKPVTEKEIQSNVLQAYDIAAAALGNTRTVVRDYYVHPQVASLYEDSKFEIYYTKVNQLKEENHLSPVERCVQEIIDDFEISFALEK